MNSYFNPGYEGQTLNNPSNHLMQFLKRPVILVIAVCTFLSALVSAISAVMSLMTSDIKTVTQTYSGTSTQYNITPILSLIGVVITVLVGVAYLMINLQSKKGRAPTGAVTIMQVISIVYLVLISIVTLIYSICYFIIMASMEYLDREIEAAIKQALGYMANSSIVDLVCGIIAVIFSALFVLFIVYVIYYICMVMLSFRTKKILKNNALVASGATGIGVINIIVSIFLGLAILIFIIAICGVAFTSDSAYTTMNGAMASKSEYLIEMVLVLISGILGFVLCIAKAKAAFGMKKHMKNYNGPVINQQTPTSYYGDNYSNYDNTALNQNGFNNTGAYNGYNNGYNNSGYGNQNYNAPSQNNDTNTNPYQY